MQTTGPTGKNDWIEHWRGWSRNTGRLLWRVAEPRDLPAIRRLQNISARFLGVPQKKLSLFELPILIALVAEDERGKIVDVIVAEKQVEIIKMGCSAAGFEESDQLQCDLAPWLRSLGFRTALATTPPKLKEQMTPGLMRSGFKCLDQALSYWGRFL